MSPALRLMKKFALIVPALALWSCAAVSQPQSPEPQPQAATQARPQPRGDGAALAERFIRPHNATAAIVFDDKGRAIVVNKEGRVVPACQVCTPELERQYGPQCSKAAQATDATMPPKGQPRQAPTGAPVAPICNRLFGTTVQGVKPISVLRHTGSECMTFFFDNGGHAEAFQLCW